MVALHYQVQNKNMQTKQTIAIIGATGSMGSALAKSLAKGNYRLLLKSNKAEALKDLVAEIKKENLFSEEKMATTEFQKY